MYLEERVPGDLLTSCDAVALNKWLSLFVIKVRKHDGTRYPTKTFEPNIPLSHPEPEARRECWWRGTHQCPPHSSNLVWMQQWREQPQRTRCEVREPTHAPACSQPEPVGVGFRSQESSWGMDGHTPKVEATFSSCQNCTINVTVHK